MNSGIRPHAMCLKFAFPEVDKVWFFKKNDETRLSRTENKINTKGQAVAAEYNLL